LPGNIAYLFIVLKIDKFIVFPYQFIVLCTHTLGKKKQITTLSFMKG